VTQLTSYFNPSPTADPRTRGSVRRASGFVQIPIKRVEQRSTGEYQFCPLYDVGGGSVNAPAVGVT
jgi:hypothetical protein